MPQPSHAVMRTSTAVRPAAPRPSSASQHSPAGRCAISIPRAARTRPSPLRSSNRNCASAARCASSRVRSTRSSAGRSACTVCCRRCAPGASSASRRVRSTASRWSLRDARGPMPMPPQHANAMRNATIASRAASASRRACAVSAPLLHCVASRIAATSLPTFGDHRRRTPRRPSTIRTPAHEQAP